MATQVPGTHRRLQVVRAPGRERLFLREVTVELLGLQIARPCSCAYVDAFAPSPFQSPANLRYKGVDRSPRLHTWQYTRAQRRRLSFFVRFRYRKLELPPGET